MKILKHTNQSKKLILVIVCIMLFSFCCPKQVHANDIIERVEYAVVDLLYMVEKGILTLANNIFCDDSHDYKKGNEDTEIISLSPDSIIKGKFLLMDANIFKNITDTSEYLDGGNISGSSILTGRNALRDVISGWYYALRNLAIVALLSILTYVGIRMLMTSVSQDKAKYKTMLKDWIIALCLLFAMHYIMIASLNICSTIVDAIGTTGKNANTTQDTMNKINTNLNSAWTKIEGATSQKDKEEFSENIGDAFGQIVVLGGIIGYTVIFAFKYLKRMITIVFLILLAPITCITYPVDKIADGKAQAYNRWFQEFLYNVIIQPFHLLIYIVLVGSATELADTNVLYAIMCFAIMIPAEKLIREMFGFKDKLGSPLGAFASGALFSKLAGKGSGGSSGSQNSGSSEKDSGLPPPTKNTPLPGAEEKTTGGDDGGTNLETDDNAGQELGDGADTETDSGADQGIGDGANPEIEGEEEQGIGDGTNPETDDDTEQETGDETNSEGNNDTDPEEGNNADQDGQTEKEPGRWERAKIAANNRTSRHFIKKYGTTKIKGKNGIAARMAKKGLSKAYSGAKNAGRKTIKGATSVVGAGLGYLAGAMFGQGKAGAAAGAALGSRVGNGITNATDKAWGSTEHLVGDMHNAFWNKEEENDKRKFKENESNIKLARQNYRERHGTDARGDALNNELEKMYEMQSHGIEQKNFNDTLRDFETYTDPDGTYKMNDTEAMNTAMSSALQAQNYSAKDFKDEKTMKQAYEELAKEYKKARVPQDKADEKIRQILNGGARMRGVKNPPLPPRGSNQTVDIPVQRRLPTGLRESLGIHESNMTPEREERISTLTMKLKDEGFDQAQINELAESAANSRMNADGVIKNYDNIVEAAIEYKKNSSNDADIEKLVRGQNAGGDPTRAQIDAEKNERFVLRTTLNIKDEKDVTAARQLEESTFKTKTDKQIAREYAKANRHAIKNGSDMTVAKKQLETILKEKGNLSQDKAKNEADKIHDFVTGVYNKPTKDKK